jgi:hypothetical protein
MTGPGRGGCCHDTAVEARRCFSGRRALTDRTAATAMAGKPEPRNPKICLTLPPVIPRRVPSFRSPQADSRSKPWGACRATLWELDQRSKLPRRLGSVPCPPRFSHGRFVLTRPAKQFARQWRLRETLGPEVRQDDDKTGAISIPPRRAIAETGQSSFCASCAHTKLQLLLLQTSASRACSRSASVCHSTDDKRTDLWVAVLKPSHPSHPTIPPTPSAQPLQT